jgi:hypothetical protein
VFGLLFYVHSTFALSPSQTIFAIITLFILLTILHPLNPPSYTHLRTYAHNQIHEVNREVHFNELRVAEQLHCNGVFDAIKISRSGTGLCCFIVLMFICLWIYSSMLCCSWLSNVCCCLSRLPVAIAFLIVIAPRFSYLLVSTYRLPNAYESQSVLHSVPHHRESDSAERKEAALLQR